MATNHEVGSSNLSGRAIYLNRSESRNREFGAISLKAIFPNMFSAA